jgi:iron complex outermembrane receptor protein
MIRFIFVWIYLFCGLSVFAQYTVKGKITDDTGNILIGANVIIEGTLKGTITNQDGQYRLSDLKPGQYSILVSYIGYEKIKKTIELEEDKSIDFILKTEAFVSDEIIVRGLRANEKDPVTKSTIDKQEFEHSNLGQDLPLLLQTQTSIVTTSDAGAGIGYTGIRIRGSDASRTNVTINGVPLNDAESQDVFWVDIPDFAENADNIQIQRGVGTSTNGPGAFGASMNLLSASLHSVPYAEVKSSAGSFNTFKNTLGAGTGLINSHFTVDVHASLIKSEGFIDRASSNLRSYYAAAGYYSTKDIVKFITFGGSEKTYQAWNGIPGVKLNNDTAGMRQYIHDNYLTGIDSLNFLNSNPRKYNSYLYDNQTDNYWQNHYQLIYIRKIGNFITSNLTLHYTKGFGYYEEYKPQQSLSAYKLDDIVIGTDTITTTDLIRRLWLDNDFYGGIYSINYHSHRTDISSGFSANWYDGLHYGQVIWARYAGNGEIRHEWYNGEGIKNEQSWYFKVNQQIGDLLNVYADIQQRLIQYKVTGIDKDLLDISQQHKFNFFNPKAGFRFTPSQSFSLYSSFGVAQKEPTQADYTDRKAGIPEPKSEKLYDWETGISLLSKNILFRVNYFLMYYKDQLVLTGALNDVGDPMMMNVDNSYRTGIELEGKIIIIPKITWELNATASINKIENFTNHIIKYDQDWNLIDSTEELKNKSIAYSPTFVAGSNLSFLPFKNLILQLQSKYVGKQYLDNTESDKRKLNPYFVNNLLFSYDIPLKLCKKLEFNLLINNLFNSKYVSNGWVSPYYYMGQEKIWDGYFPQAGINFLAGLTLDF